MRMTDVKNCLNFLMLIIRSKLMAEYKNHPKQFLHAITFRRHAPNGGAGGGSAVLSCQKALLPQLDGISIKYTFIEENRYSKKRNELWDLLGAIDFVYKKTRKEKSSVYITHDYGTAFGLALLNKKYVLVSHIQGSRVEEKTNFGEKFSGITKKIINFCEKYAFKRSYCVSFPSEGAYEAFCNSKFKTVKKSDFVKGPVLYNTLYAYPESESIPELSRDEGCLTFLSVGQLTFAKGMDKHPQFFQELLANTTQRVRYIFVGKGPLSDQILNQLSELEARHPNFKFQHIPQCTYPQMSYLQDIADVYLMLHRVSIFDLTTLEVMRKQKVVILSSTGGNPEFNKNNNIIMVTNDNYSCAVKKLLEQNLEELGYKNRMVYEEYFSNSVFRNTYSNLARNLLKANRYEHKNFIMPLFEIKITDIPSKHFIEYCLLGIPVLTYKSLKQGGEISKFVKFLGIPLASASKNTKVKFALIGKEKNHGYITYRFLGKRLFSLIDSKANNTINLKTEIKKEVLNIVNQVVRANYRENLNSSDLTKLLGMFTTTYDVWQSMPPEVSWMYIRLLLNEGQVDRAKNVLDKAVSLFGFKDMERYLPVATFAIEQGYRSPELEKAEFVWRELNKNIDKIEEIFQNKTVAIVGNGPSELGKGLGQEIDAHDIVIRFNNFDITSNVTDYGKKVDVWYRGSGASDVLDRDITNFEAVIWEADYNFASISHNHLDILFQQLTSQDESLICMTKPGIHSKLKEISSVTFPTTGLVAIYYIMCTHAKEVNCYGFSFLQEDANTNSVALHYNEDRTYAEAKRRTAVHNLIAETRFLKTLIQNDRTLKRNSFISKDTSIS